MSFQKQLEASVKNISTVGNAVLDLQMKKALLDEQRDRVNVTAEVYVPGPMDDEYGFTGVEVAGLSLSPLALAAIGAGALFLTVKMVKK